MENTLTNFSDYLINKDKTRKTVSSYLTDVKSILKVIYDKFYEVIDDIEDITEEMVKEPAKDVFEKSNYSPCTLKRRKHGWNAFCKFLGKHELKITRKINTTAYFRKNIISTDNVLEMIDHCEKLFKNASTADKKILYARQVIALNLGLNEGLRVSEYKNLKFSDIEEGMISIVNSKHNNSRQVILTSETIKAMMKIKKLLDTKGIFQKENGKFISERTFQRWIKATAKEVAIAPKLAKTHGLRHRFAYNYLIVNKSDIHTLASILGHKSIETTRIYLNLTDQEIKKRMEQASISARRNL
ncbi:MAG: site-specific integrase [Defluviitaleaceae bacterium]|nr:site-specific integrase [Defluviitaleaceae bacterium]